MTYLDRANELYDEVVKIRRDLHKIPETGFELPQTLTYVANKLVEYGYEPVTVGRAGITCTVGSGDKCIMLRADMDALPLVEETNIPFASKNGNAHMCGHDNHTAMLLLAAKMLKERESELKGVVKFMFQPAEELIGGALDMIDAGIMSNPKVDAAVGIHDRIGSSTAKTGVVYYKSGSLSTAGDSLNIKVYGKTAHGSTPQLGVDAINIAMHIGLALQELVAREVDPTKKVVLLIGKIWGGFANNSVADECEMAISMRCETREIRDYFMKRIKEITEYTAKAFGGTGEVISNFYCAAVMNDEKMTFDMVDFLSEILPPEQLQPGVASSGGEDFSAISELVPSVFLHLGFGSPEEGSEYELHHPRAFFREEALPVGAAVYAHCAERWLEKNS